MTTSDDQNPQELPAAPPPRPRRFRKRWVFKAVLTGLGGLAVALAVGFILLIGRDLRAPDWLQDEVQARIAEAVPNLQVGIGQISLRVEPSDLSPRVFLQNVTIKDETGLPFASLSELSVRASFRAALRGKFLPKKIALSGALVKLRRARDGRFDLTIGSALQSTESAPNLAQLIDNVDGLLVQPALNRLTEVRASALTVLYEDARAGRAWTVDGGRVRLERRGDDLSLGADFALLGGQDYATTLAVSYDSAIGSRAARIGLTLADAPSEDIASQTPALAWMKPLRAPISGALRTEVDAAGALGLLNATLQIGEGVMQPDDAAKPIPFDGAQAYFTFDPERQTLDFTQLSVKSAWVNATAEGRARLTGSESGLPTAITAQLQITDVSANPFELYPEPVTLERGLADVKVALDPFEIQLGQIVLEEAGQQIVASGHASVQDAGWQVALDAKAPRLVVGEVLKVWPEQLKPKTRGWIEQNVLEGQVRDARFAMRLAPEKKPDIYLDLAFEDAAVLFMKTMPPMTDARGKASLSNGRLLAFAEQGRVAAPSGGSLTIDGTSFEIPDTTVRGGPARVQLVARGPMRAAFSLLDQEPFAFLTKAGQSPSLATGRMTASGTIDFALRRPLPPSEISFDVAGRATGVRSERLVPDRVVTSDRLDFKATSSGLRVAGAGRIDGVGFEGAWQMPLGQPGAGSELTGQINLSERFVTTFNIGLPPGSVSGQGRGDITIALARGEAPRFALTSNLAGVGLRFDPLGFRKAASARASLSVTGVLGRADGAPPRVDRLALSAPGLEASGSVRVTAGGGLERASFDRVRAGNWLDAPVTLTGRGAGRLPAIAVSGGRVDLRGIPSNSAGGAGARAAQSLPLDVRLDQLTITDTIALRDFRGAFTSQNGLRGDFSARINGTAPVQGQTEPRNGRTAVRLQSGNAGDVISASGLLKNASEGALTLDLIPTGAVGTYDGSLEIEGLRLREPPDSLALLSAASGIGLLEQLDGNGLMFNEVSGRFRLTPKTLIVSQASAVGPSIGLSVDGFYDIASKQVDMQGVVSPLYALNGLGAFLTRKGEGLIGFNYTLQGLAAAPRVQVNPLSLFTPGMFREIFRRAPPDLSQ